MPTFRISQSELEVHRTATIVDTNVLLAAFWPDDSHHLDCQTFLFDLAEEVVIAVPVLVETWGLLVGKAKRWDCGLKLLEWLASPASSVVLIDRAKDLPTVGELIGKLHVDCVDAYLVHLAHDLSKECAFEPPITVATYDTGDFMRCRLQYSFRLRLWDLNSFEIY